MKKLLLILVAMTSLMSCHKTLTKDKPSKPNVVFILIDDLSMYGVSAYGSHQVTSLKGDFEATETSTPNIDKLAETGLLCNNAFAYPLCEPTRIALMSGQYNNRNFLRCKSQHASDITFGDTFKKAGYTTGIYGKWKQTRGTKEIKGEKYISEFGWDDYCCFDVTTEGQRFINPFLVINGEINNYQGRTDNDPQTGRRWYGPDICNRQAIKFIETNKSKPFFLYYPMLLVHDDHKPTPDTKPNSIFDNFDEANNNRNGHTGDDPKFFPDMIAYMDKLIGNIVSKLDELGLRENTLIVVMGDNGTKECFAHILPDGTIYPGRKGGTMDNGLHVPLILNQLKTIKSGDKQNLRRYDGLVDITDIYPTIAEAIGLNIPNKESLDGISFWPQVLGSNGEPRTSIYTWYNGNNPYTNTTELLEYAFNKSFKRYAPTIEYPQGRFFDLRTDPLELGGSTCYEHDWGLKLYSGLDLNNLTDEQTKAYNELGDVIKAKSYIPVEQIKINEQNIKCEVGDTKALSYSIFPKNATRKNIIWESKNTSVASVNKFGEVKAVGKGTTTISIYSWDDAYPTAANESITYSQNGLTSNIEIIVQ